MHRGLQQLPLLLLGHCCLLLRRYVCYATAATAAYNSRLGYRALRPNLDGSGMNDNSWTQVLRLKLMAVADDGGSRKMMRTELVCGGKLRLSLLLQRGRNHIGKSCPTLLPTVWRSVDSLPWRERRGVEERVRPRDVERRKVLAARRSAAACTTTRG